MEKKLYSLCIPCVGPLQAWNPNASWSERRTVPYPTKSGIIGLCCAALGLPRNADISFLNGLKMFVRKDNPGDIIEDFQTATSLDGHKYIYHTQYIVNGAFLVVLESDNRRLLETISEALLHPVYILYLGRCGCLPSRPLSLGVRDMPAQEVLKTEPWLAADLAPTGFDSEFIELETVFDAPRGSLSSKQLRDVPISFDPAKRQYAFRKIEEGVVTIPTGFDSVKSDFSNIGLDSHASLEHDNGIIKGQNYSVVSTMPSDDGDSLCYDPFSLLESSFCYDPFSLFE